jgi:RNA polymerase sigma-70 factor (ECF subfamily)
MPPSDEELMGRVRAGEHAALSTLFDRHGERLFRYCWRMNQDRQLSEDMVQETFCRMLRFRESYRDGHSFQAWMYSIVRNMQMDHWRKRRFEAQWEEGWDAPSPRKKGLEQAQETELLHKALGLLPPSKREILVMARFQGMKHEEIAAVIGCEPAAARVRLHRALASLKETYLGLLRRREAQ